jgi:hypothetical protein
MIITNKKIPKIENKDLKPGSYEAVLRGCICPILDNEYGEGMYTTDEGHVVFVYNSECPIHGIPINVETILHS